MCPTCPKRLMCFTWNMRYILLACMSYAYMPCCLCTPVAMFTGTQVVCNWCVPVAPVCVTGTLVKRTQGQVYWWLVTPVHWLVDWWTRASTGYLLFPSYNPPSTTWCWLHRLSKFFTPTKGHILYREFSCKDFLPLLVASIDRLLKNHKKTPKICRIENIVVPLHPVLII